MTDEFQAFIASRRATATSTDANPEGPEEGDRDMPGACYSVVSADRMRKVMLELRFRTGDGLAVGYAYLLSVGFDPSAGITLDFGGRRVGIAGRHLRPLYEALVAQRVAWVRELDSRHAEATAPAGAVLVTGITVTDG